MSVIEKKLPTDVKKEWAKFVSSDHSTVGKTDKFPSVLKFLLNQKQAIEYENAELRNDSQVKGYVHLSEKNDSKVTTSYWKPNKCLCHEGAHHLTPECRVYLSKSIEKRKGILKEKGACWSCLMVVPEDIMQLYMKKNTKLTSLHLQIRVTTEVLIHVFYKFKGFKQKGDLLTNCETTALPSVSSQIKSLKRRNSRE